jgi:hypothetical protein
MTDVAIVSEDATAAPAVTVPEFVGVTADNAATVIS